MRVILPFHLGSGNRGCEGIARGIANIFKLSSDEMLLYDISSYDFESDKKLELDRICQIKYRGSVATETIRFVTKVRKRLGNTLPYLRFLCNYFMDDVTETDSIYITGGDIYCYEGQHILPNMIAKRAKEIGAKTVLFGVSMDEKLITSEVCDGLAYYDQIVTRESMSCCALKNKGFDSCIIPDPAFSLNPVKWDLPEKFGDTGVVGINISPFTYCNEMMKDNINNLVKYIISNGMKVCLIPHVFWKEQDDRKCLKEILDLFDEGVFYIDCEKLSYLEIRYLISKCKYFIGSRTHSVISAYSTKTPCIALGYSVKSVGIAKDIGMPDYTIVDCTNLWSETQILDSFKKLEQDVSEIYRIYESIDKYANRCQRAREFVLVRD